MRGTCRHGGRPEARCRRPPPARSPVGMEPVLRASHGNGCPQTAGPMLPGCEGAALSSPTLSGDGRCDPSGLIGWSFGFFRLMATIRKDVWVLDRGTSKIAGCLVLVDREGRARSPGSQGMTKGCFRIVAEALIVPLGVRMFDLLLGRVPAIQELQPARELTSILPVNSMPCRAGAPPINPLLHSAITRVSQAKDRLVVTYKEMLADPSELCVQQRVKPAHLISVRKSLLVVQFVAE